MISRWWIPTTPTPAEIYGAQSKEYQGCLLSTNVADVGQHEEAADGSCGCGRWLEPHSFLSLLVLASAYRNTTICIQSGCWDIWVMEKAIQTMKNLCEYDRFEALDLWESLPHNSRTMWEQHKFLVQSQYIHVDFVPQNIYLTTVQNTGAFCPTMTLTLSKKYLPYVSVYRECVNPGRHKIVPFTTILLA